MIYVLQTVMEKNVVVMGVEEHVEHVVHEKYVLQTILVYFLPILNHQAISAMRELYNKYQMV